MKVSHSLRLGEVKTEAIVQRDLVIQWDLGYHNVAAEQTLIEMRKEMLIESLFREAGMSQSHVISKAALPRPRREDGRQTCHM